MITALDAVVAYQTIIDKLKAGEPLISDQIETLYDTAGDFFPEGFDKTQMQGVLKELYYIIASEDRYIPNLIEEYVLASCIDTIKDNINLSESLLTPMPRRDEVKRAIKEYFTTEC